MRRKSQYPHAAFRQAGSRAARSAPFHAMTFAINRRLEWRIQTS
jgi:hypothetical protein